MMQQRASKFKQGERVRFTEAWLSRYPKDAGKVATVDGHARSHQDELTRVLVDGEREKTTYHNDFLEPAREE